MKTKSGLDRIDVPFEIKQFNEEDDDFFVFEGFASTFGNLDLVDDIVMRGAFVNSIEKQLPVVLWQHSSHEPIGITIKAEETSEGLFVRGQLPKDDTFVKGRVAPQMRIKSIKAMSIGFRIIDQELDLEDPRIRRIKEVDLLEISLVTFPANPKAVITAVKTVTPFLDLPLAEAGRVWDASAAIARIREFTDSIDEPTEKYREAFLWWDPEAPELFASYKLPYADVIDGTLTAIPRALNNAKARLDQTDIPEADKPGVLRNIERYQAKLEDEKQITIEVVKKITTRREFEKLLRDAGLSKSAAEIAASNKFNESLQGEPADDDAELKNALATMNKELDSKMLASEISKLSQKVTNHASIR